MRLWNITLILLATVFANIKVASGKVISKAKKVAYDEILKR